MGERLSGQERQPESTPGNAQPPLWTSEQCREPRFEQPRGNAAMVEEVIVNTVRVASVPDVVADAFTEANRIYNPHGLEIRPGRPETLSDDDAAGILGSDMQLDGSETVSPESVSRSGTGERSEQHYRGRATEEALNLLRINRQPGRPTAYFVPSIAAGPGMEQDGEAFWAEVMVNLDRDLEGFAVAPQSSIYTPTTFAHELGHVLQRAGHVDLECTDDNRDRMIENDSNDISDDNLMAPGTRRTGTNLTDEQVARMHDSPYATAPIVDPWEEQT